VGITLSCDNATARALAARMLQVDETEIADEDCLSVVGEFTNVIAGRIQTAIAAEWGNAKFTLPKIAIVGDEARPAPDVSFRFEAPGQPICLDIGLRAADSGAAAA
jgi:CheY-specific phosphatase CheX